MEGSTQYSMNGSLSPKRAAASSCEESGWTDYLQDFMASEEREATSSCSSCADSVAAGGSSLVSDAASCVLPCKASPTCHFEAPKCCKKLKRQTKLDEDSLEDTASSPVSSPKVSDMNKFVVNSRKRDDMIRDISQEKELAAAGNLSDMREIDFVGSGANECSELKKRGLCLVPLTVLVDYL